MSVWANRTCGSDQPPSRWLNLTGTRYVPAQAALSGSHRKASGFAGGYLLERETGIEPATFSLGKWLQIENKEHSEFRHLFQAIEFRQNSQFPVARLLMEFKWSSRDAKLEPHLL
jgi:hypothetical protein